MSTQPALEIRYWGTTGGHTRYIGPGLPLATDAVRNNQHAQPQRHDDHRGQSSPQPRTSAQAAAQSLGDEEIDVGVHTTCVEVRTPHATILLDAGSGILAWDRCRCPELLDDHDSSPIHLFLSHAHLDHICGLPFLKHLYATKPHVTLYGASAVLDTLQVLFNVGGTLPAQLQPVTWEQLTGIRATRSLVSGSVTTIGDLTIEAFALNHPGGSLGYRLERRGRRFAFLTDHETSQHPDPELLAFLASADLVYQDAQYSQAEYDGRIGIAQDQPQSRRGWGHGTVESAVTASLLANVSRLHLGHHDPWRSPAGFGQLLQDARTWAEHSSSQTLDVRLACEGHVVRIDE